MYSKEFQVCLFEKFEFLIFWFIRRINVIHKIIMSYAITIGFYKAKTLFMINRIPG